MYAFKILSLIVVIVILAYFIGMLFFCLSFYTTYSDDDYTFYNEYGMSDLTETEIVIRMVYFAITTLTTIGFGDYNPKSEIERLFTCFILLAGVCCFSFIMGQFMEIVIDYRKVSADNQQSKDLSRWLGLVSHFNQNQPLPREMSKKIETYFQYYWAHDKNYASQSEISEFMEQLPLSI
jgi:hypothetical protein